MAALAFLYPLCIRAIILSDEGYLLQQSLDLLHGKVIYRDMDSFITPGIWFLLAATFAVFGASVFVSRILILLVGICLILLTYRLVRSVTTHGFGLFAAGIMLFFNVWSFPAWTFAFYSPIAILFSLVGLERLLRWSATRLRLDLFLCGVFFGLAICFKQNYGVFGLIGAAMGYLALKLCDGGSIRADSTGLVRDLGTSAAGVVAAALPFVLYLLYNGAMPDAYASLVLHPFEFMGQHDIPYAPLSNLWKPDLYGTGVENLTYMSYAMLQSPPIKFLQEIRGLQRMHVLLYMAPPLLFAAGLLLALLPGRDSAALSSKSSASEDAAATKRLRIDAPLFAVVSTCALIFTGVLPRADFNHLVNVYQPVLIAAPIVLHRMLLRLGPGWGILRCGTVAAVAVVVLAYAAVAVYWYAALVRHLRVPLDQPRGGVLVTLMDAESIDQQVRSIVEGSSAGEAVLTVPDLVMLNFLAEREVPSPYYNLYQHHIAADQGAAVVAGAEAHDVNIVVTRYDNFFSDRVGLLDYAPKLSEYIITHFKRRFVGRSEGYIVYERRSEALEQHAFESALEDCDVEGDLVHRLDHLLFSALYHHPPRGISILPPEVTTLCRVHVPGEGSVLSLEIGYRQPYLVRSGSNVRSTVSVIEGDVATILLEQKFWIKENQKTGEIQIPFKNFELDLSRWAGKDIVLSLQSFMSGAAVNHPIDFKGFALVWRDPRLQAAAGGAKP